MAQIVEHSPRKCETLSSINSAYCQFFKIKMLKEEPKEVTITTIRSTLE
jgi:hypothetical protein